MGDLNQVLGVYSKNIMDHTGTGATMQKAEHKTYYYVTRSGVDEYHVQPLNDQHVPSGLVTSLTKKQFISTYAPDINYYERKTLPALKSLKSKIDKGEEEFSNGNLDKAEQSFTRALFLDPENPKANLGMGSVQCSKKNFKKLSKIIEKLLNNDEVFLEEQRQEFNMFAISLRKQSLFDEAINFYSKAIEINENDENLHFNIARAYFDAGMNPEALKHIEKALEIDPSLEWAIKFKKYIIKKS
ncbi:tetratricopeptide repeat protein [Maridesulfovibrio hydrothermalis]|uniref:Tetratricopeptide TPR_2 repeat protein n=1 Tax=Maridesulfovibrio hydrothermalis AM13 = DSM 14728 TaxID=1121451 RepID=L0RAT0_9BACT|nr:tetratricopeptide repeat protein [Maridesulfovibrio hydrothermalis]CCO23878.1 Tetratricopeptide TPR_2 repeat protein [Maridesulfovibrio hydrothermalis AM13 = DSM 14728]